MSDEELIREYTQLVDSPYNPGEEIRILRGDGTGLLDAARKEEREKLKTVAWICPTCGSGNAFWNGTCEVCREAKIKYVITNTTKTAEGDAKEKPELLH